MRYNLYFFFLPSERWRSNAMNKSEVTIMRWVKKETRKTKAGSTNSYSGYHVILPHITNLVYNAYLGGFCDFIYHGHVHIYTLIKDSISRFLLEIRGVSWSQPKNTTPHSMSRNALNGQRDFYYQFPCSLCTI